eukprot:767704-Hanusia_phi.AAC.8
MARVQQLYVQCCTIISLVLHVSGLSVITGPRHGFLIRKMNNVNLALRPSSVPLSASLALLMKLRGGAKSKNHTNHNQNRKAHRNGIKRVKKHRYESTKGRSLKLWRNDKYSRRGSMRVHRKNLLQKKMAIREARLEHIASIVLSPVKKMGSEADSANSNKEDMETDAQNTDETTAEAGMHDGPAEA